MISPPANLDFLSCPYSTHSAAVATIPQKIRLLAVMIRGIIISIKNRKRSETCQGKRDLMQARSRISRAVHQLRRAGLGQLVQLGHNLSAWSNEIAMWRFTRSNGITG